ncbi:MAG: diaminobutyrate--2-oxoglutarate transaminase [Pseudomonadota bacterium]|nr:diaminobutyrate--2-oxoglutarate transaminase [Pseudomonadota bacterium]
MTTEAETGASTRAPATIESEVRSYCRGFPATFASARNARLTGNDGRSWIDFLAGCSSLNYGHNDPAMKAALLDYIAGDGIAHGLDMATDAKTAFLDAFRDIVLAPRKLDYRVQFTGPTGANAVEAAFKLARKVTGRHSVIAFTNGFHGVTLGALAATGNGHHRGGSGTPLAGVTRMPFEGFMGPDVDTADYMDRMLSNPSSGIDAPAAVIVETVQGEGGLNAASGAWLRRIEAVAKKHGALFIIDDIQAGCGRTGSFFSFEPFDLDPDIITMAKSLSGFGLPFAVTLMKPEHDIWSPAEHNGTFRGNNHAFVTARVALENFWRDGAFEREIARKSGHLGKRLKAIAERYGWRVKGRGMMQGIETPEGAIAGRICRHCFEHGLIIETSGAHDEVVKVLVPLTVEDAVLDEGLDIMEAAFAAEAGRGTRAAAA